MKKLVALVFVALAAISCNEELGPEHSTPPVFTNVKSPTETILPTEEGYISATVTSQYGLQTALVQYYVLPTKSDEASDEVPKVLTKTMKFNMTPDATTQNVEVRIPAQKAGMTITWQLLALSHYSVVGWTEIGSYKTDEITPI